MVKLLSNFDTKAPAKNYAEAVQEFGFDKVVFLRRHKLYFILYTLIPVWTAVIMMGIMVISMMYTGSVETWLGNFVAQRSVQIILVLLVIYLLLLARARYFNYILDYTVVTPTYISSYNQTWIFSRKIRTIEPSKIKTIDFSSKWIINSIFNFGDIIILLEWDELGQWEINISFIANPEDIKEKIKDLTNSSVPQQ